MDDEKPSSFVRMLVEDAIAADNRHSQVKDQRAKRELVRAIFAAVEGISWVYREHVTFFASATGNLLDDEKLALSEKSYSVDKSGKVNAQARFVPLLASLRLIARVAHRVEPSHRIDFSSNAWTDFQRALRIRHRITHPKRIGDLALSTAEVELCKSALDWVLSEVAVSLARVTQAGNDFADTLEDTFKRLNAGDEMIWKDYQLIARQSRDDS